MPNVYSVKLKSRAGRFLHLQLYLLHYLKAEGSGTNTWMPQSKQFLVKGIPWDQRNTKSPKNLQKIVSQ